MQDVTKELKIVLGKWAFIAIGLVALYFVIVADRPTTTEPANGAVFIWLLYIAYHVIVGLIAIFVLRSLYRVIRG